MSLALADAERALADVPAEAPELRSRGSKGGSRSPLAGVNCQTRAIQPHTIFRWRLPISPSSSRSNFLARGRHGHR